MNAARFSASIFALPILSLIACAPHSDRGHVPNGRDKPAVIHKPKPPVKCNAWSCERPKHF